LLPEGKSSLDGFIARSVTGCKISRSFVGDIVVPVLGSSTFTVSGTLAFSSASRSISSFATGSFTVAVEEAGGSRKPDPIPCAGVKLE
jgi:hypothetical protein